MDTCRFIIYLFIYGCDTQNMKIEDGDKRFRANTDAEDLEALREAEPGLID